MTETKKTMQEFLDSDAAKELAEAMHKARLQDKEDANNFWNSLSYDDKCHAFQAVVERIYQGDVVEQGSYRYVLYDVFKFGPDMYGRAMDCGYLTLHNRIIKDE